MRKMTNIPTISVIVPAYNVEKYLKEAIDSVIHQTVPPYEIIIINDGSTDSTTDIAKELYGHCDNIKIIHTKNKGQSEARNIGTNIATGDFIYYFDSDDILLPNLFESFYATLTKHPDLEIYCFSAESFLDFNYSKTNMMKYKLLPSYRRNIEKEFMNGEEAFIELINKKCFFINLCLHIYLRRLWVDNLLSFKPIIHEDNEFTPRLFFIANKTIVTKEIFLKRRVRSESLMQNDYTEQNIIGYVQSVLALESLILKCSNLESKKCIEKRIVGYIFTILQIKYSYDLKLGLEIQKLFDKIVYNHNNLVVTAMMIYFFIRHRIRYFTEKFVTFLTKK